MLTFPNAKINLGLNIIEKRNDGFHNIESVFYPIGWCDALEIIKATNFSFTTTGLEIPGNSKNNLIIKAFDLLYDLITVQEAENGIKNNTKLQIAIHLHKVLPMGAGIGGGSADGAFALKMINEIFALGLDTKQLQDFASRLGSDCPFFIENTPKFCFEKGNKFKEIELNLKGKYILLINPQIHISTAEAYSGVVPKKPLISIQEIIKSPIKEWKGVLTNDFEENILKNHLKIARIKNDLYDLGASYASMTGSGSTVFGIFEKEVEAVEKYFKDCILWQGMA